MNVRIGTLCSSSLILLICIISFLHVRAQVISGTFRKWHNITLTFNGVNTCEDASPNPFTDYRLSVTFTKGSKSYMVPGYFAADGNAGNSSATCGNKWRVHFIPDEIGTWNYSVSFRSGVNIAISDNATAGTAITSLNGTGGSFFVQETNKSGKDFRSKGKLKYTGKHHLQFEDGSYFLKGGTDSPENFLAYWEFDGTYNDGNGTHGLTNGLHRYPTHVQDWNSGDPAWQGGKGKGIIGALNYLAEQGMNSVYFLTMNINGDGDDTWPYTSPTQRDRFDISKLAQWEIVFSHMDSLGIMPHIVTQESENQNLLDNGELGNLRKLYYRELIARFAHHLAITWNLGEENGRDNSGTAAQSTQQRKDMAEYFKFHDPYKNFVTVHNYSGDENTLYDPLLGYQHIDGTSLQLDITTVNMRTIYWRNASSSAGRKWVVFHDETEGGVTADGSSDNHETLRKRVLWGHYMGGGAGIEWYFGTEDLSAENFRTRSGIWQVTKIANDFFNTHVPYWDMQPNNSITSASSDLCLLKPNEVYLIYFSDMHGNVYTTNINLPAGNYNIKWFNPEIGGSLVNGSKTTTTGGNVSVGNPPYAHSDWAVLIKATGATSPPSCSQPEVVSFTLVREGTGGDIGPLINGMVIDLSIIENFSIRANVCSYPVGSVEFRLNGNFVRYENGAPYAINGDSPAGSYTDWSPTPGTYNLIGIPYSGSNGSGTQGISEAVTFSVIGHQFGCTLDSDCDDNNPCSFDDCSNGECANTPLDCDDSNPCTIDACNNGNCMHQSDPNCSNSCTSPEITSLTLVNASGAEVGQLTNGTVINLSASSFSVRANVCGQPPGSVEFRLNGNFVRYENYAPYSVSLNPAPGTYTIIAIPFSGQNGMGNAGISETVTFTVTQSASGCTLDTQCNDGNPCTIDDCNNGQCTNELLNCSDTDVCTIDACNNGTCTHQPDPNCNGGCAELEVVSFSLVRASDGADLGTLINGTIINLGTAGGFSIKANVCNNPVGSIEFVLNGNSVRFENYTPYSINGDYADGSYAPWNPSPGTYTLIGIPYPLSNGNGVPGIIETVTFTVVQEQLRCTDRMACNDNNLCTSDNCVNNQCIYTPMNCSDNDACTTDGCNNGNCTHQPISGCNTSPCPQSCNDNVPCTVDITTEQGSCQHVAVSENPDYLAVTNPALSWRKLKLGYNANSLWYPPHNVKSGGNNRVCITVRATGEPQWNKIEFRPQGASSGAKISDFINGADSCSMSEWTTFCIPLSRFAEVDFTQQSMLEFPYSNGAEAFGIHVLKIEYTGGTTPFLWFGFNKTNNYHDGQSGNASSLPATLVNGGSCGIASKMTADEENQEFLPEKTSGEFRIFPNPFTNELNIEFFSKENGKAVLKIFNSFGQSVKLEIIECRYGINTKAFHLDHLEEGLYLAELLVGGKMQKGKVLKIKD